jgi:hypothetical protein
MRLWPRSLAPPLTMVRLPFPSFVMAPSTYPPTFGISAYFPARPLRSKENSPFSEVGKDAVAPLQIFVLVQLSLEIDEALDVIEAIDGGGARLGPGVRIQSERCCRQRRHVVWKIGVEDQERLTRDTERQFHARKDDEAFFLRSGFPALSVSSCAARRTKPPKAMS